MEDKGELNIDMAHRRLALRDNENPKTGQGSDIWDGSTTTSRKYAGASRISPAGKVIQEPLGADHGDGAFLSDPFAGLWSGSSTKNRGLEIIVREHTFIVHDETPTSKVEGKVYVIRTSNHIKPSSLSLSLTFRDKHELLEQMRLHTSSDEGSDPISIRECMQPSDRAFRVRLSGSQITSRETLVATYSCLSQLRPIPLLMKGRIISSKDSIRAAFKLRSNPSYEGKLTRITVILAVPFHVDSESVKLVPSHGVWDETRRTVCWCIDHVSPGEAVDFLIHLGQAPAGIDEDIKLPVFVHASCMQHFSRLEISADVSDPITKLLVNYSGVVVHRKTYG